MTPRSLSLPSVLFVSTAAALAVSCASANQKLVAKTTASVNYYAASYNHKCQGTGGNPPPECKPCQAIINNGIWMAAIADTNLKIGYMPPQEIAELEELVVAVEACP